jgi:uncharacterized protein (TIGR00251 family)
LDAVSETPAGVRVRVRIQPKAARNSIRIEADGRIRVAVTAPPVNDAANRMLVSFLASVMGVPKRTIRLVAGHKSREKVVEVKGLCAEVARDRLRK